MDHRKIEGTEIFVEWEVCQIVVDIEEEGILVILWWLGSRHPIQFVCCKKKRLDYILFRVHSKNRVRPGKD